MSVSMTEESSTEVGRRVVKAVYEAFAASDIPGLLQHLDESMVVIEADGLPYAGRYEGHAGFLRLLGELDRYWTNILCADIEYVAENGKVVVLSNLQCESRATGRRLDRPMCEVWHVVEGKVVLFQPFYFDIHEIRHILGLS